MVIDWFVSQFLMVNQPIFLPKPQNPSKFKFPRNVSKFPTSSKSRRIQAVYFFNSWRKSQNPSNFNHWIERYSKRLFRLMHNDLPRIFTFAQRVLKGDWDCHDCRRNWREAINVPRVDSNEAREILTDQLYTNQIFYRINHATSTNHRLTINDFV